MSHFNLPLGEAECWFEPHFLGQAEAHALLGLLQQEIPWQQDEITLFGKQQKIPRQQCFMGDADLKYAYSGFTFTTHAWHTAVLALCQQINQNLGSDFNAVLLNLYRDGADSMGWHCDDEPELGQNPNIASLSLGASRRFLFKNKADKQQKHEVLLNSGSLLWMGDQVQDNWLHSLPKTTKVSAPRINLTFRKILPERQN